MNRRFDRVPARPLETSHRLVRFLVALLLLAPALLAGYTLPRRAHGLGGHLLAGYFQVYAHLGAAMVRFTDPTAHAIGPEIRGRAAVSIATERDAIDVIFPFTAAVLVFPATFRRRATGVALGVGALAALNLIRISSLYRLALMSDAAFEIARGEVFPVLIVTLAILGFVAWARWVTVRTS
jgi:exosortase/archaeosortase family protein